MKLYLDCDGVILDTISKSYEIFKKKNIQSEEEVSSFFRNLNWDEFILTSGEIDNAISKIKILCNYFDVSILTHVNSKEEGLAKVSYFNKVLPGVEVIVVDKSIKKADMVDATNNILVDDYLPNLDYWYEKKGIPVKFSDSGKKSKYTTITNLLELIDIYGGKNENN